MSRCYIYIYISYWNLGTKTPACQISYIPPIIPQSSSSLRSWRLPRRWKLNDLLGRGGGQGEEVWGSLGVLFSKDSVVFCFSKKKQTEFQSGMVFFFGGGGVEKNGQPESFDFYSMLKVIFEHILRRMLHVYYLYLLLSWDKNREKSSVNSGLVLLYFHPGIIYLPSGKLT